MISQATGLATTTTTTTVLWPFVWDYRGKPIPEETFTHSHQSWSSTIHNILPDQFTCLTVFFHNLSPKSSLVYHLVRNQLILHTILQTIIVFFAQPIYQHSLFCCSTEIMSSIPSFSLNSLLGTPSFTLRSTTTRKHHPFNGPWSRTTQVRWHQKGKTNLDLLEQETVSGSGISWAICKSVPRPRQITTPTPTTQTFTGRKPFLLPNQQHQTTEGFLP